VDVADTVDAELGRLISKRASQDRRPSPDKEHDVWRESVRAYEEKRRQMARLEWHAFHCGQAERHRATLESLVSYHEEQAQRLLEDQQIGGA
jgi:hypothetical protein